MSDQVPINFKCLKCGSTEIVVSDGYADDSMTSCKGCGQEFGRWADVKAKAVEVTKQAALDKLKKGMGPGWKWK
jgi:transcription elongation factor Elf1